MSASPDHQLFHAERADEYVTTMRLGVDHLADALRRVAGPLAEMSWIYLDDAVWFHEPTYAAHLNCPVVPDP